MHIAPKLLFLLGIGGVLLVSRSWMHRREPGPLTGVNEADSSLQAVAATTNQRPHAPTNLARLSNRAEIRQEPLPSIVPQREPTSPAHADASPQLPNVPDETLSARDTVASFLRGEFSGIASLAAWTRAANQDDHPDLSLEEQTKLEAKLRPIWDVFKSLEDEAIQGNENALRALATSARTPELAGLALRSIGELAGQGSEGALNILLNPNEFSLDALKSSVIGALKPAAETGNLRAIQALAAVAEDDRNEPLWFMAADGLKQASASGNATAIDALISFSRSHNPSVLQAVHSGLEAAARQNSKAAEALRLLNARLDAR